MRCWGALGEEEVSRSLCDLSSIFFVYKIGV